MEKSKQTETAADSVTTKMQLQMSQKIPIVKTIEFKSYVIVIHILQGLQHIIIGSYYCMMIDDSTF